MSTAGGFIAGSIIGKLLLDKTGWDSSVKAVTTTDQAKLKKSAEQIGASFTAAGKTMGLAGAAIVGSLGAMIKTTANAGDAVSKLSQKTGISTELLSSYKLAADLADTSLEGFATGMRGLARVMNDANTGLAESKRAFDAIGVSYADAEGNLRPLNDVMLDVAERFAEMPDGAQKTATAMELFGRSGMDMIPMLNLGREGLEANRKEAERLGVVFSTQAGVQAEAFNDSLTTLQAGLKGTYQQLAVSLMPALTSFIAKATDAIAKITEWAKEHPGLAEGIGETALKVGLLVAALGPGMMILGKLLTLFPRVIAGIAGIGTAAGLTTIAINAGVVALGYYVIKLMELSAAEDRLRDATRTLAETENKLVDKLSEAAVAADWQFGRMSKLIEAYDGNITALTIAIKKGKEGKDIQEALAKVGAEHAVVLEEQKKKLDGLAGALSGASSNATTLKEELGLTFRRDTEARIKKLNEALLMYRGKLTADQVKAIYEEIGTLSKGLKGLTPNVKEAQAAVDAFLSHLTDGVDTAAEDIADGIAKMMKELHEEIGGGMEKLMLDELPASMKLPPVDTKDAKESVRSFAQEVSTVISDAMRNISRSIVDVFNFKKLFGAVAIDIEFDSSAFDALVDAADSAYRKISDTVSGEYDEIYKTKRREYEDARDLIEDSVMDEAAKKEALKKLDRDYEDWVDLTKKQEKEKLLAIEEQHKRDLDQIRKDEDEARKKLADDEEKRQNSLWFKVKGIVATAIEEIATAWLTSKILDNVSGIFDGIADKAEKALGDGEEGVGGKVKGLGTTIGKFITDIGTGIGGFISGLATGIGTAIVALATAVAEAATILAAAAPAILVVGAIALGLYAGIKAIGALIGGAHGGAGDGMGRVVERQDQQTAILQSIIDFCRNDVSKALLQYGVDYMGKTMDAANAAVGWLDTINGTLTGMKGAASGAVSTQTQMMMVHGSPTQPEYVLPEPDLRAMLAGVRNAADTDTGSSLRPQNTTIQIYLDKNNKLAEYVLQTVKNGSQTNRLRGLSAQSFA